jgi:hypothetical protein
VSAARHHPVRTRCVGHARNGDPVRVTTGHHWGTDKDVAVLAVGPEELDLAQLRPSLKDALLGVLLRDEEE